MALSPAVALRTFSFVSASLRSFFAIFASTSVRTLSPTSFASSPSSTSRIRNRFSASTASGSFSRPDSARADRKSAFIVVRFQLSGVGFG